MPEILGLCDRFLGEIGRRRHFFSWLRRPGAGAEEWLAVDAYYPASRVVVVCSQDDHEPDVPYAELVPAHGLRLLTVSPDELGDRRSDAARRLERLVSALRPAARTAPQAETSGEERTENPVARAFASLAHQPPQGPDRNRLGPSHAAAAERAARFVAAQRVTLAPRPSTGSGSRGGRGGAGAGGARVAGAGGARVAAGGARVQEARGRRPRELETFGVLVGLVLAAVLAVEVYIGVLKLALGAGEVLLALGLALDTCARVLGTISAERAGDHDWAWLCVLLGSPAVARFTLFQRSGPILVEPAPVAGLISMVACGIVSIAAVAALLGA